jgi:hypothetical protein
MSVNEAPFWARIIEERLKDEWGARNPMKVTHENGMKKFSIFIVADEFSGKSKEERETLVRDAIGFKPASRDDEDRRTVSALGGSILEIKAMTPTEHPSQ